jgi:hypothetical protein
LVLYVYTWRWPARPKHVVFLIWYNKQIGSLVHSVQSRISRILRRYRDLDCSCTPFGIALTLAAPGVVHDSPSALFKWTRALYLHVHLIPPTCSVWRGRLTMGYDLYWIWDELVLFAFKALRWLSSLHIERKWNEIMLHAEMRSLARTFRTRWSSRCIHNCVYVRACMCGVLHEKLILAPLVKKFPAFNGTWNFITLSTGAHHRFVPRTRWLQSTSLHFIS